MIMNAAINFIIILSQVTGLTKWRRSIRINIYCKIIIISREFTDILRLYLDIAFGSYFQLISK